MLVIFALLASVVVSVSATLTNITVTDNSPTINYTPSRSGNSAQTWNVSYTGNDWSDTSPGNLSQGTSQHLTYYIGATATFGFKGTGIYINGSATGSDAEVTVGGEVITPRGLPAYKSGMKDQWWDVVVKVNGNQGVSIYGITFTVNVGNDGASLSSRVIPALNEQNGPNPDLSFSGQNQWGNRTAVGNLTYNRIDTNIGNARVVLPAITGETLVVGYGSVNYDHGRFSIDSSGPVAGWPATVDYNGNSPYMSLDQIIFFGMADWGVISVTNTETAWLDISSISYTTASGGTPDPGSSGTSGGTSAGSKPTGDSGGSDVADSTGGGGTSIGVIVGAAVGGAVFVALIGVLIWFCLKRRRKANASYHTPDLVDDTRYDVDPYTETTVATPHHDGYFDNPEMAYANAAGVIPATGQYGSKSAQSRNSYASPGFSPYQPHSPGMSEGSSHQPSGSIDQSSSQSGSNRYSKTPRQLPVPGAQNQVRQETDAGRVALVPPSYDPTWAQDGPTADVVVDRDQISPAPVSPPPVIDNDKR